MKNQRDLSIDVVRGLAIFTMVGANMGPLLSEPHSWLFRYYSTFAAPIFVTLSGMMLTFAWLNQRPNQTFGYFLSRSLFLFFVAACLDVFTSGLLPFLSVDVLYLIALSLPIVYLASGLSKANLLSITLIIFGFTPIVQTILGYQQETIAIPITEWDKVLKLSPLAIFKAWIVEGWFPVFPWVGYAFLGSFLAKCRWTNGQINYFASVKHLLLSSSLITAGLVMMRLFPGPLYERLGYSEMFYPSTIGFITLSAGVIMLSFYLADLSRKQPYFAFLRPLGESSLMIYIVHLLAIAHLLPIFGSSLSAHDYLLRYGLLLVGLWLMAQWIRNLKRRWREPSLIIRWVLGG